MDPDHHIAYRLFRDHCVSSDGVFVKDLGLLGRDLKSVIMIDNAATSYKFQPKNGIECIPFIDDFSDQELMQLTPFLEYLVKKPVSITLSSIIFRMFVYMLNYGTKHVNYKIKLSPTRNNSKNTVILVNPFFLIFLSFFFEYFNIFVLYH